MHWNSQIAPGTGSGQAAAEEEEENSEGEDEEEKKDEEEDEEDEKEIEIEPTYENEQKHQTVSLFKKSMGLHMDQFIHNFATSKHLNQV